MVARPSATSLSVLLLVCCATWASATDYTVGDTSGWALNVDYAKWASGKTFAVGDNLVFTYGSSHTVAEVSESGYSACSSSNAISDKNDGNTTIQLTTSGKHFFICGVTSHCNSGMKMEVDVGGSSTTNSTGSSPTTKGNGAAAMSSPAYAVVALLGAVALKLGLFYF